MVEIPKWPTYTIQHVRMRPGMFVNGADCVFKELLQNALEEVVAGVCTVITVTLHADGGLTIEDDGRGIPVAPPPGREASALELLFTDAVYQAQTSRNYGKWDRGIGLVPINALSSALVVDVWRDGRHARMSFAEGVPLGLLQDLGPTERHGTAITHRFDHAVYGDNPYIPDRAFREDAIRQQLDAMAYLHPTATLRLVNEVTGDRITYRHPGGIAEYVDALTYPSPRCHPVQHGRLEVDGIVVEIAFVYWSELASRVLSYINGIALRSGGSSVDALLTSFQRAFNAFMPGQQPRPDEWVDMSVCDVATSLTAVISLQHPNPLIGCAGRTHYMNDASRDAVAALATRMIDDLLASHPQDMAMLVRGWPRGRGNQVCYLAM